MDLHGPVPDPMMLIAIVIAITVHIVLALMPIAMVTPLNIVTMPKTRIMTVCSSR